MNEKTVINAQLDACNNRDIDAFMKTWADDAKYVEHPDHLLAQGSKAIRERHT